MNLKHSPKGTRFYFPGVVLAAGLVFIPTGALLALDLNGNQQSDVWEAHYQVSGLQPLVDSDLDGYSNAQESIAGTNPLDPTSRPRVDMAAGLPGEVNLIVPSEPGKKYGIWGGPDLNQAGWVLLDTVTGDGTTLSEALATNSQARWFFKIQPYDHDTDGDTLMDWEELRMGFDPNSTRTGRNDETDTQRVPAQWNAVNTITAGVVDEAMREDWPDRGVFVIRRTGGLKPVTVNFTLGGSATSGVDYVPSHTGQIVLPIGVREAWVELAPLNDVAVEGQETVVLTVTAGAGYTLGATLSATAVLDDASALPGAKAAARFLIQAAFGPDQDSTGDADIVPENVEEVMAAGYEAWIDDQFTRPTGYLQPWVDWAAVNASALELHGQWKQFSWWGRVMGSPKLRPDAVGTQAPDPLRQRVAFALSQILVTSDRPETLAVEQRGMANYYDVLVKHAFGNYRDLLYEVATHPVMGDYLSHINNRKAIPAQNIYPDENFAREIMQLFTIGLWELNQDGTRKVYPAGHLLAGQPIPTYTNANITELARVFTGMTFADKNFPGSNGDYKLPMKMWDANHDCNAKTLLGGFSIPARTPSPGNTGTAGLADVNDAVGNLFNHANTGPFIARLLIQRLVTSNPSEGYISRVAGAFNDNGSTVRGDMKAVIKAILLDTEARDPAMMDVPTWGKLREPFLRVVNMARAFNAFSTSGHYALDQFTADHMQDPMSAPSVFNFFLPAHSPPGALAQAGLTAPEFQIINASSAITGPNHLWNAINGDLHRYGHGNPAYAVRLNSDIELAMVVPQAQINQDYPAGPAMDPDPLIRRLDLVLTGGTLTPLQFQIIREAVLRIGPGSWRWHRERLRLAIYLIVTSADYNVFR